MGDQPTGNLDQKNKHLEFNVFKKLTQEFNQTILIVRQDNDFAEITNRIIKMEEGSIMS